MIEQREVRARILAVRARRRARAGAGPRRCGRRRRADRRRVSSTSSDAGRHSAAMPAAATCLELASARLSRRSSLVGRAAARTGAPSPARGDDHAAEQREVLACARTARAAPADARHRCARICSPRSSRSASSSSRSACSLNAAGNRPTSGRAIERAALARCGVAGAGGSRSSVESIVLSIAARCARARDLVDGRRLVVGARGRSSSSSSTTREAPRRLRRDRQRPRPRLLDERRRDHAQHREQLVGRSPDRTAAAARRARAPPATRASTCWICSPSVRPSASNVSCLPSRPIACRRTGAGLRRARARATTHLVAPRRPVERIGRRRRRVPRSAARSDRRAGTAASHRRRARRAADGAGRPRCTRSRSAPRPRARTPHRRPRSSTSGTRNATRCGFGSAGI